MRHEVIIVGAGAAGVGMGATFKDFGIHDFMILDRHEVGASFARWPEEMRLITPSFNTTPFGILDLNAVTLDTSVANFLGEEHPRGKDYARYLRALVQEMEIPVTGGWEVEGVEEDASGGFRLNGPRGEMACQYLIWAAGEFQFPRLNPFPGAALCRHNGQIGSYRDLPGNEFVIIGAFESGVDAAVHLAEAGRTVTLLCNEEELALQDQDPSRSLSPFTRQRLLDAQKTCQNLHLRYECQVELVKESGNRYATIASNGMEFVTEVPPILAVGFRGGTAPVEHLFNYRDDGHFELTEVDESTVAAGLFLSGPLVRHEHHIFCYIYKYRQRFAVIAQALATRLDIPVSDDLIQLYDRNQMRLHDLSCCGQECVC
ncbi:MAG: NAD(P)/FAD-dependent oxidoreductase [Verrucomicrobiota bacterium]